MNPTRPTSDSGTGFDPMSRVEIAGSFDGKRRRWPRLLVTIGIVGFALGVVWQMVVRDLVSSYLNLRKESQAAEDNAPIGYVGLNLRRSYNDRAAVFLSKKDGRTQLFAAKKGGGEPDEVYDVTEASIDLAALEGGFGRDSIPGIDYPMIETSQGARGKKLRKRQDVFSLDLEGGTRVYPRDLLEKIEMVNDRDGDTSFLVLYDRGRSKVLSFRRDVDGSPVSFGSTGYSRFKQPVLYDRKTRSVWALESDEFVCVAGPLKGRSLKSFRPVASTTWGSWLGQHPDTTVVVGNDRSKPIPSE
ncbi:Protein of unknown function [Singulisphaera sp. GP187]|uniref:DUF3179 domain-containing (seleno)protein n=1 Tax=Singulisphaera sp. GP187 TaxID=1882752 RepID=UPI00092B5999|nr:DUF3179 domain-containing (seleno)protein [Singulisphaera sp. GP187]SIO67510.1 Protein of unknown function [Singulisphaera sp. GP187]